MVISCFSGDLMTHLQYSVPVAVLYLCQWIIVEIVNELFFAMHHSSLCIIRLCVHRLLIYFLIQECHQETTMWSILYAQL